ncbi:MAG: glycosyltransferase family 1 protein [Verrucomicrobia bacterium]|nr:MAG: glycosyltransferase family 1 protein [Verrucomicrobiota bacterium]
MTSNHNPCILTAGMNPWYINHTAREAQKFGCLGGYWMGSACPDGVSRDLYKRIWPYHLAQKAFYHLPFVDFEERMRWHNLPFYDIWMAQQALPEEVNVVQAPMGSCEALFKLALKSKKPILKVFDAPNSHPTSQFGYWQRECDLYAPGYYLPVPQWVRSRINREIEMADVVLCPSFFVRDTMIQNGVPPEKCFVSHFGVNTEIFKKRESLPEKPRFISVGSLTVRKGQQYLFRAFQKVKEVIPEAELICVGGQRPDFVYEIEKWKGTFTHYDGVSHTVLAKMLSDSTAFVLPSLEEGFARVLSEAMAAGLPILASYESGATTVVRDGVEGIIIQPRNIQGMADAMLKMVLQPEENMAMGEAAYLAGAKSNTWADYTKRLLDEYACRLAEM